MNPNNFFKAGSLVIRDFLLAVVILLFSTGISFAADGGEGVIQGKVVNGTAGSTSSVGDVVVTLHTYVNNSEVSSSEATTDAEGNFQFSGLATDSGTVYQLTLNYQEADYSYPSEGVQFAEGETSKVVDMPVYDTTAEDTNISATVSYMVVDVGEGGFDILEVYHFANSGDRAYIGSDTEIASNGKKKTLLFPLPPGAMELQLGQGLMDCCAVASETELVDTMAVIPQQLRTITFGYKLKYTSSQQIFSRRMEYPTDTFELWVQKREGVEVKADQLITLALWQSEDGTLTYLRFGAQDLAKGDTLDITFTGLPYSSFKQNFKWIVLGVVAVALLGLGVGYPVLLKRRAPAKVKSLPRREREELLLQIARLDDDFEAGKIPEAEYRRWRGQKKARLGELSRGSEKRG